ncbi:S8 family serine peptidase [Rathayibacter toxicus]|uniref:S8 family serine peptidase n=1 Tax=Rathayibacter toxicus TaxID=145458 RepID=UPI000CE7E0EE|nr:S8 family serine peptidase [Rathayibacter toxicus]QOD10022.1 S8 family serine peptidase [Rathayibacter toxicus]QWL28699.1 serine protease [Rathayibacter toxicus]
MPLCPPPHPLFRVRRLALGVAALAVAMSVTAAATDACADPLVGHASRTGQLSTLQSFDDGHYVVTLREPPAAAYQGTDEHFARTAPEAGSQLQADSVQVESYTTHLEQRQNDVAADAKVHIGFHYAVALNGFSAELTGAQATALADRKDVAQVRKIENIVLDHDDESSAPQGSGQATPAIPVPDTGQESSPHFLGLEGADGVWKKVGGVDKAGKGVVVGVIDTGISPENPSFAGPPLATTPGDAPYTDGKSITFRKADGTSFVGSCSPSLPASEQWAGNECNQKLIGARWFLGPDEAEWPQNDPDYRSPRDTSDHGSHTASTAAGNSGVPATVNGYKYGNISGIAPAAKVAAYKVCWKGLKAGGGCSAADMLAGIDAAVADGVDVINYSIGAGPAKTTLSVIDEAFLNAASAGVFVAVSAGNAGPDASTLDHASPWYATVAASSIPTYHATATLGNGHGFVGSSVTVHQSFSGSLVNSADVAHPGVEDPTLCAADSLDPQKVSGKIVACTLGKTSRVSKSAEVKRAGGIGMLLLNRTPNALHIDVHSVPTIQIDSQDYDAITAYASQRGATVTFTEGNSTGQTIPVPQVAGFSSRGPARADTGDVLKPDIAAPGVGILAAFSQAPGKSPTFGFMSGTSMSSPHIAGLAALLFGVSPKSSPSAVKSAMMTTAHDTVDAKGIPSADVFAQGAGQVDPPAFLTPGLLYESGTQDWDAFLKGEGYTLKPDPATDSIAAIDPSDLNQASIAVNSLSGRKTITRTVTATEPGSYTAALTIPGIDAVVSPSTLSFTEAGQKAQYTVSFATAGAELDKFATGYLIWSNSTRTVRSPVAVRPVLLHAPAEVRGSGAAGSAAVAVTPGINGTLSLTTSGLAEGVLAKDITADNGHSGTLPDLANPANPRKQFVTTVTVPEGATFARFDLDAIQDAGDLDLTVERLDANGKPVKTVTASAESADERVDLQAPEPGTYRVTTTLDAIRSGTSVSFDLRTFVVTKDGGVGALTVDPVAVKTVVPQPSSYTVSWSGLTGPARYLGVVNYGKPGYLTVVSVDVDGAPAQPPSPPGSAAGPVTSPVITPEPGTTGPVTSPVVAVEPGADRVASVDSILDLAATGWNGMLLGLAALALTGAGAALLLRRRLLTRGREAAD